jgi:hypothetical protein
MQGVRCRYAIADDSNVVRQVEAVVRVSVRRAIYSCRSNRIKRPEACVSVIGCYAMDGGLVFVKPKGTTSPCDATD